VADLGFIHRFVPATAERPPLLLLHGTGGDEEDLLGLGSELAPGAALLSPRGKVLENGMPRFFRRLGEGVFDVEDMKLRTDELAAFITKAREAYGIAKPIAVGFSNGANIAWSLLLRHPDALAGAVLMRAMMPFRPEAAGRVNVPVLILSGSADPMSPAPQREELVATLRAAGAAVTHEVVRAGHGLIAQDIGLAAQWLAQQR
jgi:phospholipase/carboxylesterase